MISLSLPSMKVWIIVKILKKRSELGTPTLQLVPISSFTDKIINTVLQNITCATVPAK